MDDREAAEERLINLLVPAMRKKLAANREKGEWSIIQIGELLSLFEQECDELIEAVCSDKTAAEVCDEAADVANFAAMLADRCASMEQREWSAPRSVVVTVNSHDDWSNPQPSVDQDGNMVIPARSSNGGTFSFGGNVLPPRRSDWTAREIETLDIVAANAYDEFRVTAYGVNYDTDDLHAAELRRLDSIGFREYEKLDERMKEAWRDAVSSVIAAVTETEDTIKRRPYEPPAVISTEIVSVEKKPAPEGGLPRLEIGLHVKGPALRTVVITGTIPDRDSAEKEE